MMLLKLCSVLGIVLLSQVGCETSDHNKNIIMINKGEDGLIHLDTLLKSMDSETKVKLIVSISAEDRKKWFAKKYTTTNQNNIRTLFSQIILKEEGGDIATLKSSIQLEFDDKIVFFANIAIGKKLDGIQNSSLGYCSLKYDLTSEKFISLLN